MPIFSDAYLQNLLDGAEEDLSQEIPCIFNRFSLGITQGISTYTLPHNLIGILQITHKRRYVYSTEFIDFQMDNWLKPQNRGVQGIPKYYLRLGSGWNKIMFYPIPSETLLANDTNLHLQSSLTDRVVVTCYRFADVTGIDIRLPDYLLRNIIKYRVMAIAYAKEGPQQNLQASKYFAKKYTAFKTSYIKIINKIPQAVQQQFGVPSDGRGRTPGRPILPTSGKWSF